MELWQDITKYKRCQRKQYEAWVCMPPKGTIIIDKVEQLAFRNMCKANIQALKSTNDGCSFDKPTDSNNARAIQEYKTLLRFVQQRACYIVSEQTPFVVYGVLGEMKCISPQQLAQEFMFIQNNQAVVINNNLLQQRLDKNGFLPWTKIRSKVLRVQEYACHVPKNYKYTVSTKFGIKQTNADSLFHAKGDFIICSASLNGQPDFSTLDVVRGALFSITYNNSGWGNCVDSRLSETPCPQPKPLYNITDQGKDYTDEFNKFCDNFKNGISEIVEVLEAKDYKNGNKSLKITGDNDNSLVLKFDLESSKAKMQGKSGNTNLVKQYELIDEQVKVAIQDVLKVLKVSPLRMGIKKLPSYINSKGEYSSSKVQFANSKLGFFFKFVINREYLFTYSVNTEKNYIMFLNVKTKEKTLTDYYFTDSMNSLEFDKIYNQVDFIMKQEKSSWKNIFGDLKARFSNNKNFTCLQVNKGVGYFNFSSKKLEKEYSKNLKFTLVYQDGLDSDDDLTYRCSSFKEPNLGEVHININWSDDVIMSKLLRFYRGEEIKKKSNELHKALEKAIRDYEELINSDSVQKRLSRYDYDSPTAETLYRMFLSIHEIEGTRLLTTDHPIRGIGEHRNNGFSFDDETYLNVVEFESGDTAIILTDYNTIQTLVDGNYNLDEADLLINEFIHSDCDEIPREFNTLIDYDYSLDFWFSMNTILEFLQEALIELEQNGFLSEDTYTMIENLVNNPGSKFKIRNLDEFENNYETIEEKIKNSVREEDIEAALAMFGDADY